jgi:hypothetical protein
MIAKLCDCGKSSDSSDTEMSTHSGQGLQGSQGGVGSSAGGQSGGNGGVVGGGLILEALHPGHNNHHQLTGGRGGMAMMDGSRLLTLSRQPVDLRSGPHDGIYSKGLVGMQTSPGHADFFVDYGPAGGRYGVGGSGEGWGRGSSYSDIRSVGYHHHRTDPVYEEIERPSNHSPRPSVSDLSEEEGQHLYSPHDLDIYHRNIVYAGGQVK